MECYDEEKEFYVIPDRICMSKRTKNWIHAEEKSLPKRLGLIQKEIALRFIDIVFGNNDEYDSIKLTVDSLVNQTLPPKYIGVVRPPMAKYSLRHLATLLQHIPIPWRVQRIDDPDLEQCLWEDLIVSSPAYKDANFYSTFQAGFIVPETFGEDINKQVNNEFLEFTALTPNSTGNGWTVPRIMYDYFMGNKQFPLPVKLKELGCPTIPVTKVVQNFPE
jgi:hypothetical protein